MYGQMDEQKKNGQNNARNNRWIDKQEQAKTDRMTQNDGCTGTYGQMDVWMNR